MANDAAKKDEQNEYKGVGRLESAIGEGATESVKMAAILSIAGAAVATAVCIAKPDLIPEFLGGNKPIAVGLAATAGLLVGLGEGYVVGGIKGWHKGDEAIREHDSQLRDNAALVKENEGLKKYLVAAIGNEHQGFLGAREKGMEFAPS